MSTPPAPEGVGELCPAVTGDADLELARRLAAGDLDAFTALVTALGPALLRAARTWVDSTAGAEDLVQDTWVTVIEGIDRFEGRSSLRTWVFGILVNLGRRRATRDRRWVPFSAAWTADHAAAVPPDRFHRAGARAGTWSSPPRRWDEDPGDDVEAAELRAVIDAAIGRLPRRQREVVTARDVLGWPADETCRILGISDGNQRLLLHRARARLRAALEDEHGRRAGHPADSSGSGHGGGGHADGSGSDDTREGGHR